MKIKQIILWTTLFLILLFILYLTYNKVENPQDFLYSDNIFDQDNIGAPIINCSIEAPQVNTLPNYQDFNVISTVEFGKPTEKTVIKKRMFSSEQTHCLITNLPYGKDNIYLKTSNPFIFYVLQYQLVVLFLIIFWLVYEFKLMRYIIQNFKKLKT